MVSAALATLQSVASSGTRTRAGELRRSGAGGRRQTVGVAVAFNVRWPIGLSLIGLILIAGLTAVEREDAGESVLLVLVVLAVIGPIVSILADNWWRYAIFLGLAGVGLFLIAIALLEVVGAAERMGPAGIAFLWPMLLFPAAMAVAGVIRFLVQVFRQSRGDRGGAPFLSREVIIGAWIVIAAIVGWTGYSAYRMAQISFEEDLGRARAGPLPVESDDGLSGETAVLGNAGLVQIWNRSDAKWTAIEIGYTVDGGAEQRFRKELDLVVHPGGSTVFSVPAPNADDGTITWRVTALEGWR